MKWDDKKYGTLSAMIVALVGVLTFLLTLVKTYPMILWFLVAIVLIIGLVLVGILAKNKIQRIPLFQGIKNFILKLLLTSVGTGIVSLTILILYILYVDFLPTALCEVIKSEGATLAKYTKTCVLEGTRENDEKVILTLVDSEALCKRSYKDALNQAKKKGYIDFIRGRYQTSNDWIMLLCTLDKVGSEERLRPIVTDNDRKMFGRGEKVPLLLAEVNQLLPDNHMRPLLKEIDSVKSVLIAEDEGEVIEKCFNKHKEKDDLYSLLYLVLSDPNVITKLERKGAYDVEYYKLQEYREGVHIVEDEKIVKLLDYVVVIKKTVRHLTPYDKLGIIGCYIDELKFQLTKSNNNQLPKQSP